MSPDTIGLTGTNQTDGPVAQANLPQPRSAPDSKPAQSRSQTQTTATRQKQQQQQQQQQQAQDGVDSTATEQHTLPQRPKTDTSTPTVVPKPVPQLQRNNPREFQISQVVRRFTPVRRDLDNVTNLSFTMNPSDPDFPFDLNGLQCTLTVPQSYPSSGKPLIRVTNPEMPRGYQINVEKGFYTLVEKAPGKSLLGLLNDLDRNLEKFLTAEKATTIKIVPNVDKTSTPQTSVETAPPKPHEATYVPVVPSRPSWTPQQRAEAAAKRQADVRQLEARMGRLPNFHKSSDGINFNIPINLPNPSRLPLSLQSLKEVTLSVPRLYNLEPCTIHLKGVVGREAENVEMAFERHARENPNITLMAHMNYLIQNIQTLASIVAEKPASPQSTPSALDTRLPSSPKPIDTSATEDSEHEERILDEERPHLKLIPRPPEWSQHESESDYDSETTSASGSDTDFDEDGEDGEQGGGASLPAPSTSSERGIILSFPNLELHNIEILSIASLSLSVKCLRCKSPLDIKNIKPSNTTTNAQSTSTPASPSSVRAESCPKCTTPFTISYTSDLLHANSIRAGTLEVTGCTITDMLPSTFQPTCSSCSTTFPVPPGMISVRGDTPIQVCRACHAKMTFTIPEVKFLRVSSSAAALPMRRPKKESLGISAGTPLPNNGVCAHYRHSYRWFRFGCCGRVYPCDRCHDAAEAHVNEHADRMICGWCSREQRFKPEDCAVCGRSVIRRRRAGGFWEGGKGTRDKKLMSRKDPRKYKRAPGGTLPSKKKA
ncbi:hypothetical protein ABEF93_004377 [Exophiala dermatitidis]